MMGLIVSLALSISGHAAMALRTPFPKRMRKGDANRVGEVVEQSCDTNLIGARS